MINLRTKTRWSGYFLIIGMAFIILSLFCYDSLLDARKKKKKSKTPFAKAKYRGFSIPQINLNDRDDLRVIVSRHPEIYMAHPSSVLLDDGKTIIMMYLNKHGRGSFMWRRSGDGGYTWSEDLPVPDGWNDPLHINGEEHPPFLEIPILYKITDPKGKQRICMHTAGRDFYPARYAVSEDQGSTWSKIKPILFDGKPFTNTIVLFSDMIQLKNGKYMCTFHNRDGDKRKVFIATTRDGISFDKPRVILSHSEAFLCEGCFIRSPDKNKIALLLRENNRIFNSMISFSEDEGKTWSKPRQMPDSLTGDRHQHTYLPDGRIFISFRYRGTEHNKYGGGWVGWIGTFEDLEKEREGQFRVWLKNSTKDCAYPTQHLLPDGTLFAATYGRWETDKPNYIIAYHFKKGKLDKLLKQWKERSEK